MERLKTIFKCVGLRVVPGGVEVKFLHQEDQVVLLIPPDAHVALGHEYEMSMKPLVADEPPALELTK